MDDERWQRLLSSVKGISGELEIALIVDSPWIPDFADLSHIEYYLEFDKWLDSNIALYDRFPEIIFVPGFWVEYGMAAEPSGFGSRITWSEDSLPTPHPVLEDLQQIENLKPPRPARDGLMPFVIHDYGQLKRVLQDKKFEVKIVAARGPLAVASWVRGVTSLIKDIKRSPDRAKDLLKVTTDLVKKWLAEQVEALPQVEGILLLDDIVGFLSPEDFATFAEPYLREIFENFSGFVRFFHNDTPNFGILQSLAELDFEVFNFSHEMDIAKVRTAVGSELCLMGNIPPVDVLVRGTPGQVREKAKDIISKVENDERILLSAGGGVAPDTPTENIVALSETVKEYNEK